jgi:hypothetical protein
MILFNAGHAYSIANPIGVSQDDEEERGLEVARSFSTERLSVRITPKLVQSVVTKARKPRGI